MDDFEKNNVNFLMKKDLFFKTYKYINIYLKLKIMYVLQQMVEATRRGIMHCQNPSDLNNIFLKIKKCNSA